MPNDAPAEAPSAHDVPRFQPGSAVPRDLRSEAELAAHGYKQLGQPRGVLVGADGASTLLYSTSEARRLKHDLWPRGMPMAPRAARPEPAPRPSAAPRRRGSGPGTGSGRRPPVFEGDPRDWLEGLFAAGFVVLDTETTGLGKSDEIIEIAALDSGGNVLLESKVWPRSGRVPPASTRVHGLRLDDLRGAPTWPELVLELERHLDGRRVLAWNAPFDERMARQTSRLWSLSPMLPPFECAMRGYAVVRGVGSGMRLERAAQVERVLTQSQQHRSLDDAALVLAVLKSVRAARGTAA